MAATQEKKQLTRKEKFQSLKDIFSDPATIKSVQSVAVGFLSPERLCSVAYQCILKTPELAECAPSTLISSLKTLSQMGCEADGIHGYLVPHKLKNGIVTATPIPSARGLMRTARSEGICNITAEVVREGDFFDWGIIDGKFTCAHRPDAWGEGKVLGFYCIWTAKTGELHGVKMAKHEIDGVMNRSRAKNGPWSTDYVEMGKKTVIKRASKQWDMPMPILVAMQDADKEEFEDPPMRNATPGKSRFERIPAPVETPEAEEEEITDFPAEQDEIPEEYAAAESGEQVNENGEFIF